MPAVDVQIYLPSFNIRSCLLLKTISGMHNKRDSYLGFRCTLQLCLFLNFCLKAFPLFAIADLFQFRCQQKQLMLLSYKICPCCPCFELLHTWRLEGQRKISHDEFDKRLLGVFQTRVLFGILCLGLFKSLNRRAIRQRISARRHILTVHQLYQVRIYDEVILQT